MKIKNILKIATVVFFSFISLNVSAQEYESDFRAFELGVKAGVNLSSISVKDNNDNIKMKAGYQFGITGGYAFSEDYYLQSELSFTTKNAIRKYKEKEVVEGSTLTRDMEATIHQIYIQLPILAAYKMDFTDDGKRFVIKAGPYFAYGIGGKTQYENKTAASSSKVDTFGDKGLKNFDFGAIFGVDIELGKVIIGFNYEFGALNLANNGGRLNNRNASITLGYRLANFVK